MNTLDYSVSGATAVITLNRPDQMNAFTVEMAQEIQEALERADSDDAVRGVIFTGAGRAFCAGMDLSVEGNVFGFDESVDPSGADAWRIRDPGGMITLRLFRMKKPVVGAIQGAAVGIGATMLLPMDTRLATPDARFGFVFSKIGICLEACSSWFLPRLVGIPNALKWATSGDIIDAEEAKNGGLVQEIVPKDQDLLARAEEVLRDLTAGRSAVSIAANRQMIWRMMGAAHPMEAHRMDSRFLFELSQGDGKEGVDAFLQKRQANFVARPNHDMPDAQGGLDEPDFMTGTR